MDDTERDEDEDETRDLWRDQPPSAADRVREEQAEADEDEDSGDAEEEGAASMAPGEEAKAEGEDASAKDWSHVPTIDAQGHDKRRAVTQMSYGVPVAKQLMFYGAALGGLLVLVLTLVIVLGALDQPPKKNPDRAPWSETKVQPVPPDRLGSGKSVSKAN